MKDWIKGLHRGFDAIGAAETNVSGLKADGSVQQREEVARGPIRSDATCDSGRRVISMERAVAARLFRLECQRSAVLSKLEGLKASGASLPR